MHIRKEEWLIKHLLYKGVDFDQKKENDSIVYSVVDVNNVEWRINRGSYIVKTTKSYVTIEQESGETPLVPMIKVKRREV